LGQLRALGADQKQKTVLIAQDVFTTFYESNVALAVYDVLSGLGLNVVFLPFRQNGKALHIKGFLARFGRLVQQNSRFYSRVAELGIPIVGIEPAVTLTYRDEYPAARARLAGKAREHDDKAGFRVQLLQEYLAQKLPELNPPQLGAGAGRAPLLLFGHCTERTQEVDSQKQWQAVFRAFGLKLEAQVTGCCGMCGVFGHETEHYTESRGVFELSWASRLAKQPAAQESVLVPGHSCRSQVKRFAGFVPRHPIEALRDALTQRVGP
jgi:Fe-S oxidoreductase